MDESIGNNLKIIRKQKGLTQKEVANLSKISTVAYNNIERGKTFPKPETLSSISAALGVLISDIWKRNDNLKSIRFRASSKLLLREQIITDAEKWLNNRYTLNKKCEYPYYDLTSDFQKLSGLQTILQKTSLLRSIWHLSDAPITDIVSLLESKGIKIYPYKTTTKNFSGMSIGEEEQIGPAIVFNCWEGLTVERWIFSIAHELGHLVLHQNSYNANTKDINEDEKEEKEADTFASHFLMPNTSFIETWNRIQTDSLVTKILLIKTFFKVSWKTVVYRLSELTNNKNWWREMYQQFKYSGISVIGNREPKPLKIDSLFPNNDFNLFLKKEVRRALVEKKIINIEEAANFLNIEVNKMKEIQNNWQLFQYIDNLYI